MFLYIYASKNEKKMKKLLFLALLISFSFKGYSQYVNSSSGLKIVGSQRIYDRNNNDYSKINGSPYTTEDFVPAKIYPLDKLFFVRYNAIKDQMEVKTEDNKIIILDNNHTEYKISLNVGNITYNILHDKESGKFGYFISVVETNSVSIYKKQVKKYYPEKISDNSYGQNKPAYFSEGKDILYIQLNKEGEAIKLPTKRKAFLSLFPSNESKIKSFISKNKIKLSKEDDLKKLMSYIDTLSV